MAEMWPRFGHGLCGQRHGLAMNWVDRPRTSADERDVVWAPRCRDCVCGLLQGLVVFSLTSRFWSSWTVTLIILGLGFLRVRLLRLCSTTAFPTIFLQPRKGPLWSCAELLQSYALCSSDQCRTVKLRLPAVRELFLGYVGKRGWGVEGDDDCFYYYKK